MSIVLAEMGVAAFIAWLYGYSQANKGNIAPKDLVGPYQATFIEKGNEKAFVANCYAHGTVYTAGKIGGLGLILWTIYKRMKLKKKQEESS